MADNPHAKSATPASYVQQRDGGFWVAGTRVSLDSIVYSFLSGESPESIAQSFPVLSLEQVYGAIAFYLARREEVDAYLERTHQEYQALLEKAREADPMFYRKLADARRARAEAG
jgi:uncharacterized protein (DUF433 family)